MTMILITFNVYNCFIYHPNINMKKYFTAITLCLTTTITFANQNAINLAKSSIKNSMKDPDSVLFKEVKVVTNTKGQKSICGSYNAKNSYGGYVGYKGFSADAKTGAFTSLEGLDDYIQSGCAGKDAELQLIQRNEEKVINYYVTQRSSEICQAYGEFLVQVIKQKKPVEVAFEDIVRGMDRNISNNKYYAISLTNNAFADKDYYKEYKPTLEEYTEFLNKIQSNKNNVIEIKYSFSEKLVAEALKKVMPNCKKEQTELYRKGI